MEMTRRGFMGHMTGGGMLLASAGMLEMSMLKSCSATDVWHEIEAWLPTGIDAFDTILAIVDPVMSPAIDAIAALVKAGFASLSAAIDSYLNAPAVDKATWAQKVKLILQDIGANLQNFLTAIGQSGNPLVKTIAVLIQVIVDTIAGFLNQIIPSVSSAFRSEFRIGETVIQVTPTTRDRKRFVEVFNNALDGIGHPELHIPRTVPLPQSARERR
jgi:hypothetical protein